MACERSKNVFCLKGILAHAISLQLQLLSLIDSLGKGVYCVRIYTHRKITFGTHAVIDENMVFCNKHIAFAHPFHFLSPTNRILTSLLF